MFKNDYQWRILPVNFAINNNFAKSISLISNFEAIVSRILRNYLMVVTLRSCILIMPNFGDKKIEMKA